MMNIDNFTTIALVISLVFFLLVLIVVLRRLAQIRDYTIENEKHLDAISKNLYIVTTILEKHDQNCQNSK